MITIPTPQTDALQWKHKYCGDPAFSDAIDLCADLEIQLETTKQDLDFRRGLYKVIEDMCEHASQKRFKARKLAEDLITIMQDNRTIELLKNASSQETKAFFDSWQDKIKEI